ncbi:MAG: rhodanese-like domain-containing protein [Hyphomicrobiales bacterium]
MTEYAGDVECSTAWENLANNKNSILVDVRTSAEWNFVGLPDLSKLQKDIVLLEWQQYPAMNVNSAFISELSSSIEKAGGGPDTEIYFLCRSGVRSQSAAIAMTNEGYKNCFNVAGGFEGGHDGQKHRGLVNGWKASNLPWHQN